MARILHVSPFGELVGYPWINKPDAKFNEDNPVFKAALAIDNDEAAPLIATLEGLVQQAFQEHVDDLKPTQRKQWTIYRPWEEEVDEETGEPTGRTILHTKQNSIIRSPKGEKQITIGLRDAADKPMSADIWAGSTARLMFSTRPIVINSSRKAGIRLDLAMVQVKELSEGRSNKGFGAVDGYTEAEAEAAHGEAEDDSNEPVGDY